MLAEPLRPAVLGSTTLTADHWRSLQITLYQHTVMTDPSLDFDRVFSAASLREFSHHMISAPFFHPTSLVCTRDSPLKVLLNKCVPNRCQLRSLVDEVSNSINTDVPTRDFLERSLQCSLLGLFPGTVPPCLEARARIIDAHSTRHAGLGANPEGIVNTLLRLRCQQTLFFSLKESLVWLVNRCNHPLRVVLEQYHGWSAFCELVRTAMDRARASLLGEPGDLVRFERTLAHVSKQKIRRLFALQPGVRDFEATVMLEAEKFFTAECRNGRSAHAGILKSAALRVRDTEMPLRWLEGFSFREGDSPAETEQRRDVMLQLARSLADAKTAFFADGSKIKLRAALAAVGGWDELCDVAELAKVFRDKRTTHFVRLPACTAVEQIRALRRVFRVPDGEAEVPKLMGCAAVCEACGTFRSFLTPKATRARSSNGLVAFGYSHALIDEETGEFYCGRKPAAASRESSSRSSKTGRALRHSRFYGKECGDTKLTTVNLIGRLLVFRGKMIIGVCCYCANFFAVKGDSWHGASLCCGRCITADGRKLFESNTCDWCSRQCRSTDLTQVWTSDKRKRNLCKKCSRPAFSNAESFSLDWKTVCDNLTGNTSGNLGKVGAVRHGGTLGSINSLGDIGSITNNNT